jgi:flavin reductase (DIM6/NTAB) family NADH-FMN oxidoreductase RutF
MSESNKIDVVLQKIPYGVSVVTVGRGGVENALTVSWMSQVSFEPPHVMVAIDKLHYSEELLRSTGSFVVNLLDAEQKRLAAHFARQSVVGEDKLASVATRPAPSGAAILTDALGWLDCEVVSIQTVGDHVLVIGRVEDAGIHSDQQPLTTSSGLRYRKSRARRLA